MPKTSYLLILSLALLPMTAGAETYKCRAPDGKVTYAGQISQTPGVTCEQMFVKKAPITQAEPAAVENTPEKPAAPADAATRPVEKSAADKALEAKRKKIETDETKKTADKAAEDKLAEKKLKEENCQSAQNSLRIYQASGRFAKINEKGEKAYLDDAEIKQKTEQAQKDVEQWCGS